MKIGLLLPRLVMSQRFSDRIYAPKFLFLSLADELVNRGHEVYVYSASTVKTKAKLISGMKELEEKDVSSKGDSKRDKEIITPLSQLHSWIEYEFHLTSKAFAHAKSLELDILHVYHGEYAHYFTEITNIPVLFTLHDPVFTPDVLEYIRLIQFTHHNFITISDSQRENYQHKMGIESIATIQHGIDPNTFPISETIDNYACFIGRYIPEKGVEDALKAAIHQNISLKLATSNNYKENPYYKNVISPLLKNPNIEQLPYLFPRERNEVLKRARVLLFPIKWKEPFGMILIEAMACGTPVIAYANGAVPEIILDGETGLLVNEMQDGTGDFQIKSTGLKGLQAAIESIYAMDEKKYKTMRKKCRERVEKYFSVQRMVDNYESEYQKLLQ